MPTRTPERACGDVRDVWGLMPWEPRRWQREALPIVAQAIERREAAIVSAIMGAGKSIFITAICAMAVQRAAGRVVIVAVPSVNLVKQTAEVMRHGLRCDVGTYYTASKDMTQPVIVVCYPSLRGLQERLAVASRGVELLVVDEVHRSEAATVKDTIPLLGAVAMVGFTATPYRSVPSESLSLWDSVVYRYTLEDALADGVLVPFKHHRWDGQGASNVDRVVLEMVRDMEGPGIVSALDIADAEEHAAMLSREGFAAIAIHSRLSGAERARRLAALRAGGVRCLVHVSLLAEGVDMPWLRWLALRRPVQARVRFLQELGRVLRSHEGKTMAHVVDPHDLLTIHGLTCAEAIGAALAAAAEVEEARGKSQDGDGDGREMPEPVAIGLLVEYLSDMLIAAREAGVLAPVSAVYPRAWRDAPPSIKQADALKKCGRLTGRAPAIHRDALKILVRHPHALTRGQVSDLLSMLIGGADWSRMRARRTGQRPWMVRWPRLDVGGPPQLDDALRALR